MNTEAISQIKLECLKIVIANDKGENRSVEILLKEATDLFNWVTRLH